MDKEGGKFSALLTGVIASAAFQEERTFLAPPPSAKSVALATSKPPTP